MKIAPRSMGICLPCTYSWWSSLWSFKSYIFRLYPVT